MDSQYLYKSSDLMKKIKQWELEYDIKELKSSLSEVAKKALEKVGISEIERFDASIGLSYPKYFDFNEITSKLKRHGYNYLTYLIEDFYNKGEYGYLTIYIYSNRGVLSCHLDPLPYKIICIDYNGKTFTLSDPLQKCPFPEDIKKSTLNILYDILDQGELTNMGNKSMNIVAKASRYPDNQIKANPLISIHRSAYNNEFKYNENGFNVNITWWYLNRSSKS